MPKGHINTIQSVLENLIIQEPTTLQTGCWIWPYNRYKGGPGKVFLNKRYRMVHHVIYEVLSGDVPKDTIFGSLCGTEGCANYTHFQLINRPRQNDVSHILNNVDVDDKGCWLWKGVIGYNGYGRANYRGRYRLVHRLIYEHLKGPIPEGYHLHHSCKIKRCINPAHLESVSPGEHLMLGNTFQRRNKEKTHCIHGHPLCGANLKLVQRDGRTYRQCQACRKIMWTKQNAKRKKLNVG